MIFNSEDKCYFLNVIDKHGMQSHLTFFVLWNPLYLKKTGKAFSFFFNEVNKRKNIVFLVYKYF